MLIYNVSCLFQKTCVLLLSVAIMQKVKIQKLFKHLKFCLPVSKFIVETSSDHRGYFFKYHENLHEKIQSITARSLFIEYKFVD